MTLSPESNNAVLLSWRSRIREPYIVINSALALIILMVFGYSLIFSPDRNEYPVVCVHEKLTGVPCPSCGLSHSFSLILRGRIAEAYDWNIYGMRIFIFFASQLFMRIVFSSVSMRQPYLEKHLVLYDITASLILFMICFMPFLKGILKYL
ncbi:MAG: DUF2752 domain-containing protein [Bacteroidales bacterium]|jgi:hypothetical protein|nr:DUF2752 domain-containing protein [Bacteroidales bacterium]